MNDFYRQECYLIMTLDPLHVGTGGNRLGRVDLSIVREPGTRLPKIPGTSLHGAIRQYAAIVYGDLSTAGGGKGQKDNHPVNYTFGTINEAGGNNGQSGRVSIGDARLLLFPVYSLAGPVWVTCPSILAEHGVTATVADNKVKGTVGNGYLNLGWLMLEKEAEAEAIDLPQQISTYIPGSIKEKVVLVSDKLFSQIVNSNLEVRTSVSIDPITGAAADTALFTYEAIPRSAILWFNVVQDTFDKSFPKENERATELGHKTPLDVVTAGLSLAEMLGVGGMGTRGFGRIRTVTQWEVKSE